MNAKNDEPDDNWCGDNLAPTKDDEIMDEFEAFNWVNNPIRQLFDNPKSSFHKSHLYEHATGEDDDY